MLGLLLVCLIWFACSPRGCRIGSAGENVVKKKAKQAAALDLLRVLYPHVQLWGQLVESTNSRQKENKIKTKESRAAEGSGSRCAR